MSRRYDVIGTIDATGVNIAHGAVSVTTTATKIPTTNLANRKAIVVRNCHATEKLYLGGSGVTTANGYWLNPTESLSFDLSAGAQLYGICATGTVEVRYIELDNS